ncbi:hypothetical protein WMY93_032530 [Mugilogobius chulae]|uniref:Uncharacterized protein n=1 Tax=Mugilogobius chulae TaxID=88201 RepID=A0AAW0MR70_9GOBI
MSNRRIGAASAVLRSLYQSVVVKKQLSRKAKLSIYGQSTFKPSPRAMPRTRWRGYVSGLAWERLGILPEELEEVCVDRKFGPPSSDCCLHDHDISPQKQQCHRAKLTTSANEHKAAAIFCHRGFQPLLSDRPLQTTAHMHLETLQLIYIHTACFNFIENHTTTANALPTLENHIIHSGERFYCCWSPWDMIPN